MKKVILLTTCALFSVASIAQNRLDASKNTYYDQSNGSVFGTDSTSYHYYLDAALQNAGTVKPVLEFGFDVPFYNFEVKDIKADSVAEYNGSPLAYSATTTNTYNNSNLLNATYAYGSSLSFRTLYTFDGNGNTLTEAFELYNGTDWDINDSVVYSYDANENLISRTKYNASSFPATVSEIDSITYDGNGNKISYDFYTLDGTGTLYLETRNFVTYDGANFEFCYILENDGNGASGNLDSVFNIVYYYTGNLLDSLNGFEYANPGFETVPFAVLRYTHNAEGNLATSETDAFGQVEYSEFDYNADGFVIEARNFDNSTGTLELGGKSNFYYTNIAAIEENKISLGAYPNPATDVLTIDTKDQVLAIQVVDMAGRTILVQKGNLNQVHVSSLKNGMYVMQVQTTNGVGTVNFVKN